MKQLTIIIHPSEKDTLKDLHEVLELLGWEIRQSIYQTEHRWEVYYTKSETVIDVY